MLPGMTTLEAARMLPGAWTPEQQPFPEHDVWAGKRGCLPGFMRVNNIAADRKAGIRLNYAPQQMCLRHDDIISDALLRKGRWHDCGRFVRLWRGLDHLQQEDVLLEIRWTFARAKTLRERLRDAVSIGENVTKISRFEPDPPKISRFGAAHTKISLNARFSKKLPTPDPELSRPYSLPLRSL